MPQHTVIILRFREETAAEFEHLFEAEVMPLWREYQEKGKFQRALLSRIVEDHLEEGGRYYMLDLELPGMPEHEEFDEDPRFLSFLKKVRPLQAHEVEGGVRKPVEPAVWIGEPLFRV